MFLSFCYAPTPVPAPHAYKCGYGQILVVFDSYVGVLNLLSDPCGIDNLAILANNSFEEA
jgi:hypothetical protein